MKLQTTNLEQTKSKSDETWRKASTYPVNISPRDLVLKIKESREFEGRSRRIGVFSKTQEIQFKRARDSRGFGTGLVAQESQQRARRILAIMCTKNEIEIHHTRAQKRGDWIDSKAQRAQGGWGLLSQSNPIQTLTNPWTKSTLERRTGGEEHRGGGLENRGVHE